LLLSAPIVDAAEPQEAGGLPSTRPERVGMSSERLARIGPAMQHYIDQRLVAGTVTLIARKGKVVHFEARGFMDAENQVPMRTDAIFRIASMTKPITSVALMMLWEEGRFHLNDPVSRFLPEFANPQVSTTGDVSGQTGALVAAKTPITIRQLLTHTAGLANSHVGNTKFFETAMAVHEGENLEAYTKRLAALPLNYQPGEAWQYSAATNVVGRLVEMLSGTPLDRFMEERIFRPLGMKDTHFFLNEDGADRLVVQYRRGDDQTIVVDDPGGAASRWVSGPKTLLLGAGGLVSTASDYLRFQQMMLNGGKLETSRLLSPVTVSLMLENHTGDLPLWLTGPGMGFGLGYGIVVDRGKAATPLSNGSVYWGGAYGTYSWIDRDEELIGILMTQIRPYDHLSIRQDFQVLTSQAIFDF
jgi:CubicO group peptidase (beta-lactamase class C family)